MTRRGEIALGSAVTAFGATVLFVVLPTEVRVMASETGEVSPAFFPKILTGLIMAMGIVHLLIALPSANIEDEKPSSNAWHDTMRAVATFVMGAAYVALLPLLGFVVATAAALIGLIVLFGSRPIWQAAAISVPLAFALSYTFGELLKTPLPRAGWLE